MTSLSGLHHVALTVSDRDVSAEWYGRVLGMGELFREEGETRRASIMSFANGQISVGLVEHLPVDQESFDPRHRGLDHLAFTVETKAEIEEWGRRLNEENVSNSGVIDIPMGAILNFKDPDGIALAMFWDQ
jgi:glyoxylase I family protein